MQNHYSDRKGFTLIEALIYIALLALIMTGLLGAVYQVLQGSAAINTKTLVEDEGNFVLHKIDWALSGANAIMVPNINEMTVTKYDGTSVDFQKNGSKIEMRRNGGTFLPITTGNVQVTNLQFQKINTGPVGVSAVATVKTYNTTPVDFETTKYLRQ